MNPDAGPAERESDWLDTEEDVSAGPAERRRQIWTILGRAVMVYLVLFMGLGLIMSVLGVNPLSGNGLMPKALLLFVSLALVMALANTLTDLFREQRRNWLRLARRRPIAGQKPDE